jgi:hypothetical protein
MLPLGSWPSVDVNWASHSAAFNRPNHGRKVCLNLAGEMVMAVIDGLWAADIIYIRLQDEFARAPDLGLLLQAICSLRRSFQGLEQEASYCIGASWPLRSRAGQNI